VNTDGAEPAAPTFINIEGPVFPGQASVHETGGLPTGDEQVLERSSCARSPTVRRKRAIALHAPITHQEKRNEFEMKLHSTKTLTALSFALLSLALWGCAGAEVEEPDEPAVTVETSSPIQPAAKSKGRNVGRAPAEPLVTTQ
jgi:hypothetical protein